MILKYIAHTQMHSANYKYSYHGICNFETFDITLLIVAHFTFLTKSMVFIFDLTKIVKDYAFSMGKRNDIKRDF